MAKKRYNPLQAIQNDPLASLRQATLERTITETSSSDTAVPSSDTQMSGAKESPFQGASAKPEGIRSSSAPVKPLSSSSKPSRNTVYLYPEDLTKLRQLSGYASTEHGIRANDSMIVRAALALMETDVRFLHALKGAVLSDRRRTNQLS